MDANLYYNLAIKSLSDTASPEEENQLKAWLQGSEKNRRQFDQWKILWDRFDTLYSDKNFDTDHARRRIAEKIHKHRTRQIRNRYWLSAAASILILLGLGYLILMRTPNSGNMLLVENKTQNAKEILLPDGSQIWLNKNSSLRYPEKFSRQRRQVTLTGEAYFEVKKEPDRVFRVLTDHTLTKVLGTSFDLKMTPGKEVCLLVYSGRVQFYKRNSPGRKPVLTAGQKAEIDKEGRYRLTGHFRDANYLSWKTGILKFESTPLKKVCEALTNHYDVTVVSQVDDPELLLTGSFQNEKLDEVLTTIELTLDLQSTREGNKIILHQ